MQKPSHYRIDNLVRDTAIICVGSRDSVHGEPVVKCCVGASQTRGYLSLHRLSTHAPKAVARRTQHTSANPAPYGARITPFSQIIAVMYFAGVTSNAGCAAMTPAGAIRTPWMVVTSSDDRSSMGIMLPSLIRASMVDVGAATYIGMECACARTANP